ncbi:hypothetical protein KFE25_013540 [Diacronema lutheri]|uniref:Dynein light chain n=2 Tax=Diacronema lutheri TaxID=2081491 RepID=A0A8J6CB86_DIALT|nr:hypothetical protein KFE25_013540 [Diacronema lutheri]
MSGPKAVIKTVDMAEEMQTDAIEIAQEAIGSYMMEKDMANFIKREFDKKYQPTWHVIIGKSWGALVTHATKNFIYFYLGDIAILIFKSG